MAASTPRIDTIEADKPDTGAGLALSLSDGGDLGGSSSGEIYIVNFNTVDVDNSAGLTFVAQTTTTASYIEVTEAGVYSIMWNTRTTAGDGDRGISKNAKGASDPNGSGTDFTSSSFDKLASVIGAENTLFQVGGESAASNESIPMSTIVKLAVGDRIRFHSVQICGSGFNNWARIEQLIKF